MAKCNITGSELKEICCAKDFPVFMGTTNQKPTLDRFFDLKWGISEEGIVQLMQRYPLHELYAHSHNSGQIGTIWQGHHNAFSDFIAHTTPTNILEIGGGHCTLPLLYEKKYTFDNWTIVEPNPKEVNHPKINLLKELFNSSTNISGEYDVVVHSHLFEHLYDHPDFLDRVRTILKHNGKMIFSVPNMREMLKRGYVNCLNIEHTMYLPEYVIEQLLEKFGFKVLRKEYYLTDHSIFFECQKVETNYDLCLDFGSQCLYEFNNYNKFKDNEHGELCDKIDALGKKEIFLFGAHIFSQYLIHRGISTAKIISILDNDTEKQGNRLYGTMINVQSPKMISTISEPIVVLRAGVYNNEISQQLREINPRVTII